MKRSKKFVVTTNGKKSAENRKNCQQRDSVEHQEYAGVLSLASQAQDEQGGANLLEEILDK